eukprot:TRINITY_DN4645_c0_g1_i2.p1 TRINITY_DN4645_c0_g1~~TRINITY_DN4645_c0_g1_i2.p1  ORF type:complete len:1277 (-),score=332.30 TRINITY_DN4645_c0_g1_i2:65-3436(-)
MAASPVAEIVELNRTDIGAKKGKILPSFCSLKTSSSSAEEIPITGDDSLVMMIGNADKTSSAVSQIRTFSFPRDTKAKAALSETQKGEEPSTNALFVPVGLFSHYPNGHWLQDEDNLADYYNKGIKFFKLRNRCITMKIHFPEIKQQKTFLIDSFWTVKETFAQILKMLTEESDASSNVYNDQTHAIFLNPLEHLKDSHHGLWLEDEKILSSYDLINQGSLNVQKKEWDVKVVLHDNYTTTTMRRMRINPYCTVYQSLENIIDSMGQRSSRQLKKEGENNAKEIEYDIYMPLPNIGASRCHPHERDFYICGKWMHRNDLVLKYYNQCDGTTNDVLELRSSKVRTLAIALPDGVNQMLKVSELDLVSKIREDLESKLKITKKNCFYLEIRKDGLSRYLREDLTLAEQGVFPKSAVAFFFKNRFLLSNQHFEVSDESAVHLTYAQCSSMVANGALQFPQKIGILLWSLQMQVFFGDHNPEVHKKGFLTKYGLMFPAAAIAVESEILEKHKKRQGQEPKVAKFKYVQLCQCPMLVDDTRLKINRTAYGYFQAHARGLTSEKIKVNVELDAESKSVVITRADARLKASSPSTLLYLKQDELCNDSIILEKSLEDNKVLTMSGFLDNNKTSRRKNVDFYFISNAERDLFYLAMHSLRGTPSQQKIKIFTGTFNIGGAAPSALDSFLMSNPPFDLIAIGVQEGKWKKDSDDKTTTEKSDMTNYSSLLRYHIGSEFEVISDVSMWEIGLIVLCHKKHFNSIVNVETATKPTGFANVCGNKGGVGISFRFGDTSFCIINSHLPARAERILNRNQDFKDLVDGLDLGLKKVDLANQFNHFIWLGDLNYRLDISRGKILHLIEMQHWHALLKDDQLAKEKSAHRTFSFFEEGPITFMPTYRYERGVNEWSKKKLQNVPSYCDRILWKSLPGSKLHQHEYRCADTIMTSDHRPVLSTFSTTVGIASEQFADEIFSHVQIVAYEFEITKVNDTNYPQKKGLVGGMLSIQDQFQSTGGSNDYLILKAPFFEHNSVQIPLLKVDDWKWKSQLGIDMFGPLVTIQSCFQNEVIIAQMCSADDQVRLTSNVIGTSVISMKEACEKNAPFEVVANITHKGLPWGYLTGYLHVIWVKGGTN